MDVTQVDLFVIGGGSGGVRAARMAAGHGATVAIAEEDRYGGTCVIRGCIPKKLFVYASEFDHLFEDAAGYGWTVSADFDWSTLVARKDREIERLSQIYVALLERAGVEVVRGRARLLDRHTVEVAGRRFRARTILVATGGQPYVPDIPGAELAITSDQIFHLERLPERITIVGGGYIGLEFAGILQGLRRQVTLVHHRPEVLRGFDEDVRHFVTANLADQGVGLVFDTEVASIERRGDGYHFQCRDGSGHETGLVMFATGRRAKTAGIGLEEAGVVLGKRGEVIVDDESKTSVENIYAIGDCTDRLQLTPVAIREGQAFADSVFGGAEAVVDHDCVPTAVFSQPPVATVGLTESEARARHHRVEIYRSTFRPLFHTLSGREQRVMMKLVVDADSQRVLGAHMVGRDAPEIIQALAIAVKMKATKADFDRTVAIHPTTAEELVLMRTPIA